MRKLIKSIFVLMLVAIATGCGKADTYTAGTYTGEGKGFGGPVVVTITVDAEKITEVTAVGDAETASIGGAALEKLCTRAMEAQSIEFDSLAGATITSDAFKAGLEAALAEAKVK